MKRLIFLAATVEVLITLGLWILIIIEEPNKSIGTLSPAILVKLPLVVWAMSNIILGVLLILFWIRESKEEATTYNKITRIIPKVASVIVNLYSIIGLIYLLTSINSTYVLIYALLPVYVLMLMPALIIVISLSVWLLINIINKLKM